MIVRYHNVYIHLIAVADQFPVVLFTKLSIIQFGNIKATFPIYHHTILEVYQNKIMQ